MYKKTNQQYKFKWIRLFNLLLTSQLITSFVFASNLSYMGEKLNLNYSGPHLIHNSQLKYNSVDKLTFSTVDYLNENLPTLLPLRAEIDTWAALKGIHPRVLSEVLSNYFADKLINSNMENKQIVWQIAAGISEGFSTLRNDPLGASRAIYSISIEFDFDIKLPFDLTKKVEETHYYEGSGAPLFSYFQPPWTRGESWAGGGGHADSGGSGSRNALDFWKTYVKWGGDTSPYWVSATQSGIARVWSSCSVSVIHPNGWSSSYYHLDNVQVSDMQDVGENQRVSNYADNLDQAICNGGGSSGPHVHFAIEYNGDAVVIDQENVDFTSWKYKTGIENYDSDCSRSYYTLLSGNNNGDVICPFYPNLINDTQPTVDEIYMNGFE